MGSNPVFSRRGCRLCFLVLLLTSDLIQSRPSSDIGKEQICGWTTILKKLEKYLSAYEPIRADKTEVKGLSYDAQESLSRTGNECEGYTSILVSGRGLIRFPLIGVYNSNADCVWKIQGPENTILQLTITRLSIEPSRNCSYDRLEIFDGSLVSDGRSLGVFCGFELPAQSLQSTGNVVTILFRSDDLDHYSGFEIKYRPILPSVKTAQHSAECSEAISLQGDSGKLCYPVKSNYSDNLDCRWVLSVPYGRLINVKILSLDLEGGADPSCPGCCTADALTLYDGPDKLRSAPIAKLCGTRPPKDPYITTSGQIMIALTTDKSNNGKGFCLSYSSIEASVKVASECDGSTKLHDMETGSLLSPGLSTGRYPNDVTCRWLIRAKNPQATFGFNFTQFSIERGGSTCFYDRLTLYDGQNSSAPVLGTFCGFDLPSQNLVTTGPYLCAEFLSDDSINVGGFIMNWFTIMKNNHAVLPHTGDTSDNTCKGVVQINGKEGGFASPGFNLTDSTKRYQNGMNCVWIITVPSDMRIVLRFEDFYLERSFSDGVCFDCVTVCDGSSPSSKSLGQYCGTNRPADIMSSGNSLYVVFKSDETTTNRGFRVSFTSKLTQVNKAEENNADVDYAQAAPLVQAYPTGSNSGISTAGSSCGIPQVMPRVLTRIVGGEEANPHSWPWQCSLLYSGNSWQHWCGATVIDSCWVLTAAHCVYNKGGYDSFRLILGEHSFVQKEGTEKEVQIESIIIHESYNPDNNDNDLALLRLSSCVRFDRNVQPVCLPQVYPPVNQSCVATGWGETKNTANQNVLNQVCLPIIDRQQCNRPTWYFGQLTSTMFCAGYQEGLKDSCSGDSGGPLVCLVNGRWQQMGVTSWGYDCAQANHPGIYTNLYLFKDWIARYIGLPGGL